MKILYAVQATGNGHISRAMELLPYLRKYGSVDLFLSGANSSLELNAPIRFRSRGLSLFYTCNGTLDYWKLATSLAPRRIWREARDLPVEKYDLILNDFECITALACRLKKVRSIQFGHQASFMSPNTPRPEIPNKTGEWILRNYAAASSYLGLHFDNYDDFILSPVIKKQIVESEPTDDNYITVYLPSYCREQLTKLFTSFAGLRFEIFAHQVTVPETIGNIRFLPVSSATFNYSLLHCTGIITGGGFETPAEALYLQKKLMAIPIGGQYEQQCNAAALRKLGIQTPSKLDKNFPALFEKWIETRPPPALKFRQNTEMIVEKLMDMAFMRGNAEE